MSDLNITDLDVNEIQSSLREYALIVDGEFVATIKHPALGHTKIEIVTAALKSNPTVVDVTGLEIPPIASGWTWNGNSFEPPVG